VIVFFPETVERIYSNGFYPIISTILRTILGRISISIGDLIYINLIAYLILLVWKSRKNWKQNWKIYSLKIISFLSIVYFLFHLLWGYNYYRIPLHEKLKINKEYTNDQLIAYTENLIKKTNYLHLEITKNPNQKVVQKHSQDSIFKLCLSSYKELEREIPFLKYEHLSIKKSLFSLPLTYMGFSGYLNPFTNEAHVNDKIPMTTFPMVAHHEMAHQIGIGSESECNFIGFIACSKNPDPTVKYSAYSFALRYCLFTIAMTDESKYQNLLKKINPGIIENFKESEQFWNQYDTIIDKGFHAFYDQFLKLNQQKDGMESYSKFIGLLVNYYKNSEL
jgi:hypothetical protein